MFCEDPLFGKSRLAGHSWWILGNLDDNLHANVLCESVRHPIINVYEMKVKKNNMGKLAEEGQLGEN